ncbi:MAG: MFS transporter [Halobacteriaceae archaeon]
MAGDDGDRGSGDAARASGDGPSGPATHAQRARDHLGHSRWWLVLAAAAMMAVVGPYQYVWTAIESPIAERLGLDLPAIGLVFTLFVVVQAGSQFPVGWLRDRHGPRALSVVAGVLAGGGYVGLAAATAVWQVYLAYSLGAVGVGIVYTVAVNTAIKWFPDRRGLTTGAGTMAFAGGSAAFVPVVRAHATATGYPDVLRAMGVLIGVVVVAGGLVLRDPPGGALRRADTDRTDTASARAEIGARAAGEVERSRQFTSGEMVRTWQFWVLYAMFVAVSGAGLMLTAKIVQFAAHQGLTGVTATLAATVLPLAGGVGRLLLGAASDRVDRRRAMAAAFAACGLGLYLVVATGVAGLDLAFVVAVVVATFFWSPQFTLFPSLVGDYYGERHSSANYALVYSGKMWGGVFGGAVAGWLVLATSWEVTFLLGGTAALLAGVAALVLRPPEGE